MVGSLADILLKKPLYKSQMEQLLAQFVFPEFSSAHGHLRARACLGSNPDGYSLDGRILIFPNCGKFKHPSPRKFFESVRQHLLEWAPLHYALANAATSVMMASPEIMQSKIQQDTS